jgi:hypothetical protein
MTEVLNADIMGWDVKNWSKCLPFFESNFHANPQSALELGSGYNGGLSLWLASKGIRTICSGYHPKYSDASNEAKDIHKKYGVSDCISYKRINAAELPYKNEFDIIAYKSMLGGIVRDGDISIAQDVLKGVQNAMKPGG